MTIIPREEIAFHSGSVGSDPHGRLFHWNGELYRGISDQHVQTMQALLASPTVTQLQRDGLLIDAEQTEFAVERYPMVLRHPRVPFVSYPFEWPGPMLKDGALVLLDLNLRLAAEGFLTKDPSSWNVLFRGTTPVYVDFGGIWSLDDLHYAFDLWPEWFERFWLYPLRLMQEGRARIARALQRDIEQGVTRDDFERVGVRPLLTGGRIAQRALLSARWRVGALLPEPLERRVLHSLRHPAAAPRRSRAEWQAQLRRLRKKVEATRPPVPRTKWSTYYERSLAPNVPETVEGLTQKHASFDDVLARVQPESVLDVGSSTGWYSRRAAEAGATVVALDADESAAARLYEVAKADAAAILPLVMNVREPSPAYGLLNQRAASAADRLQTDLTLALALVHHLVTAQAMDIEQVVESLALLTARMLLVEFVDPRDFVLRPESGHPYGVPPWYSREAFLDALSRRFDVVDELPSFPETRTLFLCRRS